MGLNMAEPTGVQNPGTVSRVTRGSSRAVTSTGCSRHPWERRHRSARRPAPGGTLNLSRTRLSLLGAGVLSVLAVCGGDNPPRYTGTAGASASGAGTTGPLARPARRERRRWNGRDGRQRRQRAARADAAAGGRPPARGGQRRRGSTADAPILDQTGNPIYGLLSPYKSWLSTAAGDAAKLTADKTWPTTSSPADGRTGGWYKNDKSVYAAPWNGTAARVGWTGANNVELGTIDRRRDGHRDHVPRRRVPAQRRGESTGTERAQGDGLLFTSAGRVGAVSRRSIPRAPAPSTRTTSPSTTTRWRAC
jgi:hypothetical protein